MNIHGLKLRAAKFRLRQQNAEQNKDERVVSNMKHAIKTINEEINEKRLTKKKRR